MCIVKCFIATPNRERRIEVNAEIPTVFLLAAHASIIHSSNDWRLYWKFSSDPLSRIGRSWPKRNASTTAFLRIDVERALSKGYRIDEDMLALGKSAWADLGETHKSIISAISKQGSFNTVHHFRENASPISSESDQMPEVYALPFMGDGILVFDEQPLRLIGLEFEIRESAV